jgi:hypothetical protein
MMNRIVLPFLLFFCTTVGTQLQAQSLLACPTVGTPSSSCKFSCINCDLDAVTGINNVPQPANFPNSLCLGAFTLNNPAWYGFIAGSTDLTLGISPTNCQTGQGLEFALISNCETPISCSPGPNQFALPGQYQFSANNLIIGQPYQLVIDGFNGDVCNFSIATLSGSAAAPPLGTLSPIQGPSQVCPNATVTYSIPPVANAISYTWSSPAGASINGGPNSGFFPANGNNTVEVTFGNVGGNICVTASNACGTPLSTCKPVSNIPLPVTQLLPETVCYDQVPYEWPEEPHTILGAPGTYTLTSTPYLSYLGCDSIVKQTIKVLPLNQVNLPVKYLCRNECFSINGFDYCESGSFQEFLVSEQGCDSIVNFTIIQVPVDAVAAPADTITCAVTSVPLSGVGSSAGNTIIYKWLDPAGQVISNVITAFATEPGDYSLIVTNFAGGLACMDTAIVTVPGDLAPPVANAGPDKVLTCVVTQVQLQGSGSAGLNYSYFWKAQLGGNIVSGATTLNPIVNAPGTYTLRVTDNHNGCTAISNALVIPQITPPTVTAAGGTFTCTTPNIILQVATNAPSPGFSWTGPNNFTSTLKNPSVNVPGTYTVVVTNGNTGCTNTANAIVTAGNDTPDIAATGGGITCVQSTVTLGATSTFQGVTYQWSGPGGYNSAVQNPVVSTVGNYQVIVTAPNGCTNTAVAAVVLNNTPPSTTLAASGSLNCNNTSVNVLATSIGNPSLLTHAWTLPNGSTQNTGAVAFLPASTSGVYAVLVNNTATGCTSTASFAVVQYANVTAIIGQTQNANCFDSNDGSLTALPTGGNGVYTYTWSNGASTAINAGLGAGAYVLTVTDGENCSATATGTITVPDPINSNATATAQTANGAADGTATASPTGGTPGYTYLWSTNETTASIGGLLPGSYTVTVTDANNCTAVKTVNVSQFDCTLQTTLEVDNISCAGAGDGAATISFLGGTSPFTVVWSNADTTISVSNLAPGQYDVSITDAANCPEIQSFTITEPTILQANASGSTTTGFGTNDGTASANPTGGSGIYAYAWSNMETTATISNLAAGLYTVTVSDENNCSVVQTVEVLAGNCNLTTNLQITNPTCNGLSNGAATIVLTGGAGGFTFDWSTGGATATETDLPAGIHTVEVTDTNGCSILVSVELTEPAALTLTVDVNQPTTCPNTPAGSVALIAAGGTGALSVVWSDGQTGLTASELTAGTYTAVVTDENSCTGTVSVEVLSEDTEAPVIVAGATEVPVGPNGNVVLNVQNVNAVVTDNCSLASVVFQPAEFFCTDFGDHVVTITATDDAGLVATQTTTITIVDNTAPTLICSPSLVVCFEDNPVIYQAPTASDNCQFGTFNIVAGLPIGATFPLGSTTTTYNFTDTQGNVGSCSFEVTILSPLTVTVDTVYSDVNLQAVGAVFIDVSGSLPTYTYAWTFNNQVVSTLQDPSGLAAGDYSLVVTDENGCTVSTQVTVNNITSDTKTPLTLEAIRIFPNPTAGNLSVLLPDDLVGKNVFLQIFDQTGRSVYDQVSVQNKQIDLTLLGLSDGLYSLVVRIDQQQMVRKIVLNR